MRQCKKCLTIKDNVDFYSCKSHSKIYLMGICKSCYNQKERNKSAIYHRERILKHRHGITIEDYNQLLLKQNGKCAICGSITPNRKNRQNFCVDHDHKTGKIRGLLCEKCNRGIGMLQDDPVILQQAIDYLKN